MQQIIHAFNSGTWGSILRYLSQHIAGLLKRVYPSDVHDGFRQRHTASRYMLEWFLTLLPAVAVFALAGDVMALCLPYFEHDEPHKLIVEGMRPIDVYLYFK